MKNRPLLCVCLVLLFMISVVTAGGGKRFIKELRPSPVELYAKDEENVTVQGTIYRQEQKETYQKIYLKDSRVYLDSNQSRSDIEADTYKKLFQNKKSFKTSNINQVNTQISDIKILICLKSDQKFHIGNKIQLTGEVAFFDNARNLSIMIAQITRWTNKCLHHSGHLLFVSIVSQNDYKRKRHMAFFTESYPECPWQSR